MAARVKTRSDNILDEAQRGTVIEDYPSYPKGPFRASATIRSCWAANSRGVGNSERILKTRRHGDRLSARSAYVERELYGAAKMTHRRKTKYVHEGRYVAEVDVEVIEDDTSWSPYLSVTDAYRLDTVRAALRRGDIKTASAHSRVYTLQPVAASQ